MKAAAATAPPRASSGTIRGRGSGLLARMLRSTKSQRNAAPAPICMPISSNSMDSPSRMGCVKSPSAKASIAMPPARKASEVLIQARKVRSLAKVKRGSGSVSPGSSLRASRPRGLAAALEGGWGLGTLLSLVRGGGGGGGRTAGGSDALAAQLGVGKDQRRKGLRPALLVSQLPNFLRTPYALPLITDDHL
jgi:hypothetical protein